MSRFKIPLILFGSIFIVSFILAFATGSSYFSLIKALLSAVVATAFFVGAKFLLEKYVPDLFEAKDDASDPSSLGGNVDIRIQGDDGGALGTLNADLAEKKGPSPYVDIASSSSMDDGLSSLEGLSLEEPTFDDEKKESFEPSSPPTNTIEKNEVDSKIDEKKTLSSSPSTSTEDLDDSNPGPSSNKSSSSDTSEKENTKNEENPSSDDKIVEAELSESVDQDVDRLEELPDLQEFIDASHATQQSRGDELMSTGTQSFFETDLAENVTDTNLMASAVRTMLKRES